MIADHPVVDGIDNLLDVGIRDGRALSMVPYFNRLIDSGLVGFVPCADILSRQECEHLGAGRRLGARYEVRQKSVEIENGFRHGSALDRNATLLTHRYSAPVRCAILC